MRSGRFDESRELLFVLRGADHLELVSEAMESVNTGVSNWGQNWGQVKDHPENEQFRLAVGRFLKRLTFQGHRSGGVINPSGSSVRQER